MVQKHRVTHKAIIAGDVSPARNKSTDRPSLSSRSGGRQDNSSTTSKDSGTVSPDITDKWRFHNMVNDRRDQFNNMHLF